MIAFNIQISNSSFFFLYIDVYFFEEVGLFFADFVKTVNSKDVVLVGELQH
jgi:hypothetical protein